jgi:hypothetical protein
VIAIRQRRKETPPDASQAPTTPPDRPPPL